MVKKQKFYVVWVGRKPGIYETWEACKEHVVTYEGAKYKSFSSRQSAEEAYKNHYQKYIGKGSSVGTKQKNNTKVCPKDEALTVDAACSGNPGVMEYRGVWLHTGEEVFRSGPWPEGTVNIGEFLALVHGLALLKKQGKDYLPVYSDSLTAIKWVKTKHANTKLPVSAKNSALFERITRAEAWLKNNAFNNPIKKWDTAHWGEIPADFGRK
ncbi:MAG: ribonuclease H family protein [Bacteroidales bacterium]|nr:ribonuclease H family protein [Bacteroidales bacterium]